jgi:DNA repair protein RadC
MIPVVPYNQMILRLFLIKTINQIQPKGKMMYIYRPVITYDRLTVNEIKNVSNPSEVLELFRSQILGPVEKVACLFLNSRNDVLERFVFSVMTNGTVDQSAVYPREIIRMAILNNSSRIIMAHNHPTGHASPSPADHAITKIMKDSAKLLGLELLDHIIITEDTHYSFQEQNCL